MSRRVFGQRFAHFRIVANALPRNAQVMSSTAYLDRPNDPTLWTQRIMPTLALFRRGGGAIVAQGGNASGHAGHIAIARFDDALPDRLCAGEGQRLVETLAQIDWVVNAQVLSVTDEATSIATQEKSMRKSSEGSFAGLLILETLDAATLDRAVKRASELGGAGVEPERFDSYDMVFACHAS
ncbi:hypothetical protein [Paraburkholderia sp. BCC1886]|uniref:hypothetical protein n=1 Tax=Paraburkholderia sp. BCC1886 TaxID=2562670 RepID=UPI0021B3AA35|nr:hypothetical protein [Paraburkholderia sp. BCC1886]